MIISILMVLFYRTTIQPRVSNSYAPPKPQKKADYDDKKLVVGSKVRHKSFGNGTIVKYDGKLITVDFSASLQGRVQLKFAFPGAFQDGFLTFVD